MARDASSAVLQQSLEEDILYLAAAVENSKHKDTILCDTVHDPVGCHPELTKNPDPETGKLRNPVASAKRLSR